MFYTYIISCFFIKTEQPKCLLIELSQNERSSYTFLSASVLFILRLVLHTHFFHFLFSLAESVEFFGSPSVSLGWPYRFIHFLTVYNQCGCQAFFEIQNRNFILYCFAAVYQCRPIYQLKLVQCWSKLVLETYSQH